MPDSTITNPTLEAILDAQLADISDLFKFDERLKVVEEQNKVMLLQLMGSEDLGVKAIRVELVDLERIAEDHTTLIDRGKVVFATLGLTNAGTIVAIFAKFLDKI